MPWGRQKERERNRVTRERKRAVKVILWDGEFQSKENREAHRMRDREGGKRNR